MDAVRRTLAIAGLAGLLLTGSAGSASAAPTPTPDPSASASAAPSASPTAAPSETPAPDASSGCAQDPQICQSGGGVNTTTDCGQVHDGGVSSPPPPGTVCIAGGIRPGTTGPGSGSGSGSGAGAPGQLPRTGPAPVLPTLAVGSWLVLLGVLAAIVGRRRTARA